MGLEHMSTTDSHAKNRGRKMSATEKKEAELAAYRKARLQWYVLGGLIALVVVVAIILISIYTDGSLGQGHG